MTRLRRQTKFHLAVSQVSKTKIFQKTLVHNSYFDHIQQQIIKIIHGFAFNDSNFVVAFATSAQMPFQTHSVACKENKRKTTDKYINFPFLDFGIRGSGVWFWVSNIYKMLWFSVTSVKISENHLLESVFNNSKAYKY